MTNKEVRLQYYYAEIDPTDGFCFGVMTSITPFEDEYHVPIEDLNEDYLMKYYNKADGKWYLEASFTTEWTPN